MTTPESDQSHDETGGSSHQSAPPRHGPDPSHHESDPSRYYEDFAPGERFVSQGRTITRTEQVMWSMFTGDLNPIHVDEHFAETASVFGRTVPQGLLVVALASGLQERLGILRTTGRAMLSQTIVYRSPAFAGDTIWVELAVADKTARPGSDAGRVVFDLRILKHPDAKTVAEGTLTVLVARRPGQVPLPGQAEAAGDGAPG